MLRERAGAPEVMLELPDGARVRDALDSLAVLAEGIPLVMAVNREYADADRVLDPGDELALIPPVSGGETRAAPWVRVCASPLSLEELAARVRHSGAGAVVTFSGVTRQVERLEYDAYVQMAEERMVAIATDAVERHGLCAAAVEHRVGEVPLTMPSVIVAVSAPHRARREAAQLGALGVVGLEPVHDRAVHEPEPRPGGGAQPGRRWVARAD